LLEFLPGRDGEEAGLTVYRNPDHHYVLGVGRVNGRRQVFLRQRIGPHLEAITASAPLGGEQPVVLQVEASPTEYTFSFGVAAGPQPPAGLEPLGKALTRYLSTEVAGGFTGAYLALFATGNGQLATRPARFDWFEYEPRGE
jgi:alpha-N-arabinofuranosidase